MFERGCAIPAWGLVGKGVRASSRARTTQLAPRPLDSGWGRGGGRPGLQGRGRRTEREYPAEIIVPLVGGQGDAASQSQIGTATYNFAPSHSLFLNDNLIKL